MPPRPTTRAAPRKTTCSTVRTAAAMSSTSAGSASATRRRWRETSPASARTAQTAAATRVGGYSSPTAPSSSSTPVIGDQQAGRGQPRRHDRDHVAAQRIDEVRDRRSPRTSPPARRRSPAASCRRSRRPASRPAGRRACPGQGDDDGHLQAPYLDSDKMWDTLDNNLGTVKIPGYDGRMSRDTYHHGDLKAVDPRQGRHPGGRARRRRDLAARTRAGGRRLARRPGSSLHRPPRPVHRARHRGVRLLADALTGARPDFIDAALAYVRFALDHPGHYAVMFDKSLVRRRPTPN